jgi:DNA-binding CsgD family transcriptional regulator
VGREAELEQILSAVAYPPAVVLVEGEAGIGKTRLVTAVAARAELTDRLLLVGGCARIREPFPLGPVIEALRGTREQLSVSAPRLSPVTGALRPLLPEVADLLPVAPEPLNDRIGERHRVFRGLAELLGSLGRVVLVLEDMHWADEQTVDFLAYLLSEPPAELCVVLTFRGEEVDPGVRALTTRLPASTNRSQVVLAPLDIAATNELAAAVLGADRVSEDFAAYLRERTSGLPFAIQEMLALLRARGTLVRRGGGWARKAVDDLDVPAGVRDSVLERVSRLPAVAQALAEAAAVLQVLVPVSVLVATCGIPRQEAVDGMDDVLERGLFIEQSATVGFRHQLAVQAVYDSIPLPRRQALHARAAAAVELLRPVPFGQVAHHLRHSDQPHAWVVAAERAADQATALGDDSEAIRLLGAVLQHAPLDTEQRIRLAVKLGWAAIEIPHEVNAVDLLTEVLAGEVPASSRGELLFLLAVNLERAGTSAARQFRAFAEAVDHLDARPDLAAHAMVGLGLPTTPTVPLAEHIAWLERALAQLDAIDDSALQVFVLGKVAMVLTAIGDPRWSMLTARMLEQTGGDAVHSREVVAFNSVGADACYAGHYETAERLLVAAQHAASDVLTRWSELTCRKGLAALAYLRGAWSELPAELEFLGDQAEHPRHRVVTDALMGCLALARGELENAWRLLADVVDRCLAMGAVDVVPIPVSALLRLATAQGDVTVVIEQVRTARAAWDARQLWPIAVRTLPPLVAALVSEGRFDEAREVVSDIEGQLFGLDAPLAPAALAHARGLIAAGLLQYSDAVEKFAIAAASFDELNCRYEAAQVREQAASCLAHLEDAGAAELLRSALTAYDELGASWDLNRATQLARRLDLSIPTRHRDGPRGYGLELSPRESEVAGLAATGMTNKEIARELFLSPKTVDKHLGGALRKLGLHSRAALAHRLRN